MQFKAIIVLAGGPGDRWSGHRKMAGREESPDTVLSHQGKGNAPGNARGAIWVARVSGSRRTSSLTESATENIPPAKRHGGIAQENLWGVFEQLVSFGKGEKVE
jgi:hypothetical protein